jgi:hypothetical protein
MTSSISPYNHHLVNVFVFVVRGQRSARRRGGAETAGQSSRRRHHRIVLSLSFCALNYSQERTSEANRAREKIIQEFFVKEFRV